MAVALGKEISKGDEENLNLITADSVWETERCSEWKEQNSLTFLFSCRGVSGGTKGADMKSMTMWSFGPKSRLWGRRLTSRWFVLRFSSLSAIMRAKCHFQHPFNALFQKPLGTIADMTSINKMISSVKQSCCICEKKKKKRGMFVKATWNFIGGFCLAKVKLEHYSCYC